ncbi:MAG: efflux RND transporter periplasmic adaptor subunit [Phycisphaerales bacterium JB037]
MNRLLTGARALGARVWKHASAVVALVLIIGALFAGYRLGRPAPERGPDAPAAETTGAPRVYTCSMHPSVRLPDPDAKCPICFMDLIPVTDAGGAGNERRLTLSAAAASMSRIETARVARFFPEAEARLFGKVTYDETSVARLTAYFPARIERLFVNYVGVPVATGDHIAEVYSPELLAAFEELRQAAESADESADRGGIVRSATRDTLRASREKLRLYGLTDRQVAAVESGEFDSDRFTIFAPLGGVVTHLAVREGDYVNEGSPIATVADLSRLWLDLQAYESQLPLLRWGQRVTFTVEAHPGESFEGRVSFIEPMIDERTRTAAVRVAVDNSERRLKPGMFASASIRVSLAEDGAVVSDDLVGRWVSPMHPSVVKDGPGQCDVCGMDLVPAESLGIVGATRAAAEPLVIPRSAVLFTGRRSVVYVEVPDAESPTYEGREVLLGPRAGDFIIVREGLREGDRVVVNGAFRIDSAMQIAAKPSMMAPGGSAEGPAPDAARASVPESFIQTLKPVYAAYFEAQEALAADDLPGFRRAASDLASALGLVRETGLVGEPLASWRRAAAGLRIPEEIADLEAARARFLPMSRSIIALQERFGHMGAQTWHVAYCPMAFDNTGAEWLQRDTRINNPYFGAMMLRCGEIRRAFPPRNAPPSDAGEGRGDG